MKRRPDQIEKSNDEIKHEFACVYPPNAFSETVYLRRRGRFSVYSCSHYFTTHSALVPELEHFQEIALGRRTSLESKYGLREWKKGGKMLS